MSISAGPSYRQSPREKEKQVGTCSDSGLVKSVVHLFPISLVCLFFFAFRQESPAALAEQGC